MPSATSLFLSSSKQYFLLLSNYFFLEIVSNIEMKKLKTIDCPDDPLDVQIQIYNISCLRYFIIIAHY